MCCVREPLIGNTAVFFFTCEMAGPSNENAIQFNEDRLASIVRSVYTALQGDTLDTNTGPLLVCRYLQETDLSDPSRPEIKPRVTSRSQRR